MGVVLAWPPAWVTLMLIAGGALPMWWCEWRRYRQDSVPGAVSSLTPVQVLEGLLLLAVLFAASIAVQLLLGGEKGAAVSEACLPLVAAGGAMALLALLKPAWLGPGVALAGALPRQLLAREPLTPAQSVMLRSWIVRAIFLPLMIGWAYLWVAGAMAAMQSTSLSLFGLFGVLMALMYAVDTSFAVTGYLVASARLGSHVRSVDGTWQGWLSALCCYPPLSVLVLGQWLVYKDGLEWQHWLAVDSWLWGLWASVILFLTGIYTWATVVFGPRFSNLTHRGIVTAGPYRWLRHPAYLSKNLSWWFISVPFVSAVSVWAAALHCLALLAVNAIYYVRAITEERHLRDDPAYVAYVEWVDRHGILARLRRVL